jgi:hypothetical protein
MTNFADLTQEERDEIEAAQEALRQKYMESLAKKTAPHEETFIRAKAEEASARANGELDKLAHALMAQGRYEEALAVVVDDNLRSRIERIAEVVYRTEPASCSCPDTPYTEKGHKKFHSRHYTLDTVYSPVLNRFVPLTACRVCKLLTI